MERHTVGFLPGRWHQLILGGLVLYQPGPNRQVFNEFPWRWAVIGSSTLTCVATLFCILALLSGEHADALLQDWTGCVSRKSGAVKN
ncbi:MAG: hypothetical protein KC443_03445 [Anaerolineales bacterium]|nr:hypothetical protein [Anaerolineales bacterium]